MLKLRNRQFRWRSACAVNVQEVPWTSLGSVLKANRLGVEANGNSACSNHDFLLRIGNTEGTRSRLDLHPVNGVSAIDYARPERWRRPRVQPAPFRRATNYLQRWRCGDSYRVLRQGLLPIIARPLSRRGQSRSMSENTLSTDVKENIEAIASLRDLDQPEPQVESKRVAHAQLFSAASRRSAFGGVLNLGRGGWQLVTLPTPAGL